MMYMFFMAMTGNGGTENRIEEFRILQRTYAVVLLTAGYLCCYFRVCMYAKI